MEYCERAVATFNNAITVWRIIAGTVALSAADFDTAVAALATANPKGNTSNVNILKPSYVASCYDAPWFGTTPHAHTETLN